MKKFWGILLIFFGIVIAWQASTTTVQAKDYQITRYNALANVQANGDVELTQKITYNFEGDFHGVYYDQDLQGIRGATDPQVSVVDDENTTDLVANDTEKENTFKVSKTKNNMDLKIYHSAKNQKLTYIFKYRLLGAITNYSDTAELNWKMIGEGWSKSLNHVTLKVILPQKNITQLQAWTHGPNQGYTKVDRKNGRVIMTLDRLPAHDFIETHMIFPTSVTATNQNIVNRPMKKKIQKQEASLAKAANEQRKRRKIIYPILLSFGYAVIILIYVLRWVQYKRNPRNKHIIPTPLFHSFDEPDVSPSMAQIILNHQSRASTLGLSADLLNEAGKRRIKIEKVGKNFVLTALVPPTDEFYQYLFNDIGDGKKVSLKQIKTKSKISRKLRTKFTQWTKDAAVGHDKYLDVKNMAILDNFRLAALSISIILFILLVIALLFNRGIILILVINLLLLMIAWITYFRTKKMITLYTDLGEEKVNGIRAFKRMLNDIDDIKMAEVGDLVLWEQFLPYAVVFGISDKVIKAMKVNFTQEQINNSFIVPYYIGRNSFAGLGSNSFTSSMASSLSNSGAGSSSSISGSSGGFSGGSSGGFGGGSGGGAF